MREEGVLKFLRWEGKVPIYGGGDFVLLWEKSRLKRLGRRKRRKKRTDPKMHTHT